MNNFLIGLAAISATVIVYILTKWIYQKFPFPLTLPILTGTIMIIMGLILFQIPYETYYIGGEWIERLLGPAVVALAFPLYQHRNILMKNAVPILTGVFIGSVIGIASGILMGKWLGFDRLVVLSIAPKSVTTPVAMDIARSIDGLPTLAAVLVVVAGISGAVLGPVLFKWIGIYHYIGKGIGMGSSSHAIGTAKAMEASSEEGAISTIAMILSAIIVSVITPVFVGLFM